MIELLSIINKLFTDRFIRMMYNLFSFYLMLIIMLIEL